MAACDLDNDGYQDLYVGAMGRLGDNMDYRSINISSGLREITKDRLFRNNGDGTFAEITESAFGPAVNIRSTKAVACADVDGDGWLDIYTGNHGDMEFVRFDHPAHHGHYNDLFRNNGDMTFTDVSEQGGVAGGPIVMRNPGGEPISFGNPQSGTVYEGYDPELRDAGGSRVGDPSGQTWGILFYDYDDDGDPDLWVADDGDRLKVYRNESTPGSVRFVPVARRMGLDQVRRMDELCPGGLRRRRRPRCLRHERRVPSAAAPSALSRRRLRLRPPLRLGHLQPLPAAQRHGRG